MTNPLLLTLLGALATATGALLVAGLAGDRAQGRYFAATLGDAGAAGRLALWVLLAAGAVALPAGLMVVAFAAVSVAALAEFFAVAPRRAGDRRLHATCFAAIPLQYAFVATASFELFTAALPLAATLALPLLALREGHTRDLLDRVSECGWGVLAGVYCVSHAAAILMLDLPGAPGQGGLLVAFLVVCTHADDAYRQALHVVRRRQPPARRATLPRIATGIGGSALATAALGAALAGLTPFSPALAAACALLLALLGALGRFVMACLARDNVRAGGTFPVGWRNVAGRAGAVAFAAPVFYHLLRALYVA